MVVAKPIQDLIACAITVDGAGNGNLSERITPCITESSGAGRRLTQPASDLFLGSVAEHGAVLFV